MQYAKLPGLTWDGTIYQNDDMGILEALLPTGGYPTAHAPALLQLPDGDLLCCWFAGTYEGSADILLSVHFFQKTVPHGFRLWISPVIPAAVSRTPHCSMVLIMLYGQCTPHSWIVRKAKTTCSTQP